MIKLPFNLDVNAPLSKVIYQPTLTRKRKNFSSSLAHTSNRIVTQKLRYALFLIKLQATKIIPKNKQANNVVIKKRSMLQLLNLKVLSRLSEFWHQLRLHHINSKKQQQKKILEQSKKQTFEFVLPIIEQRIKMFCWRRLLKYVKLRQNKQKLALKSIKATQKIIKRKIYSSAFLLMRVVSQTQTKKHVALLKMFSRIQQKRQFNMQFGLRKLQNYWHYLKLQQIHKEKKAKVNKIYDVNAERGNMLQNQRQTLRNLKYKLDHDSVQKNHIITDRRRQIMLVKSKFNEQNKQLQNQIKIMESEIAILQTKVGRQKYTCELFQTNRQKIKGLRLQKMVKDLYSVISDLFSDGKLSTLLEIIRNYQENLDQGLEVSIQNIKNEPEYQFKLISVLEMFIKFYQRKQDLSAFKLKDSSVKAGMGNITLNISNSRFSNVAPIVKKIQQSQYQRANDQNRAVFQLIQFLLQKQYETGMDSAKR